MSLSIERRLRALELVTFGKRSGGELQRLEGERIEELVEKVKAMYPDEADLHAALDKVHHLSSSETMEDIEEHRETVTFILRQFRRLEAKAAQTPK